MQQMFSVIIPALNESDTLGTCLSRMCSSLPHTEWVVVDGGSKDGTANIAEEAGAKVVFCPAGRGVQCNTGAADASGDILLFLHADTLLPVNAWVVLTKAFQDPSVETGKFRLVFDDPHPVLRLYESFSHFDSIFTSFGDQCITVRRSFFHRVGGFPAWPLFEDVAFLQRARSLTRVHTFPATVTTSARRYRQNGVVRQQLLNLWLMLRYLWGVSPGDLSRRYGRGRG